VPGCGKGYDVSLFASLEAPDQKISKAVGLDVSPKAVEEAQKIHHASGDAVEFIVGDFFSDTEDWAREGPYDVVYDYTVISSFSEIIVVSLCSEPRYAATVGQKNG